MSTGNFVLYICVLKILDLFLHVVVVGWDTYGGIASGGKSCWWWWKVGVVSWCEWSPAGKY